MERRRPTTPAAPASYAVGIDVGGTKIAGGIVELRSGQIVARQRIATRPERGGDVVLAELLRLAEQLLGQAADQQLEVLGIGVGVCELVDPAGNITSGHTIDWRDQPVQEQLHRLAPAVVEADVRAAALGEAIFGAGQGLGSFAYITLGTGISGCLVVDGQPWTGARGNALILGSGALTSTCPVCGTTSDSVLEDFASGPALVDRYNRGGTGQATSGEDVMQAVARGDRVALEVVESAGAALGNSVAFLVNILDPEAVVVGGGLGQAGGHYWQSFEAATRAHIWADGTRPLRILRAALGPDAGIVGAGVAVWRRLAAGSADGRR